MPCFPPGFTVRDKEFVALLDRFAPAPYTHAQFSALGPSLLKGGVRLALDSAVVVDESSLVACGLCVHPDTDPVGASEKRQIVVGAGAIVAMHLADIVKNKCARRDFLGRKEAALTSSRVGWFRNNLDGNGGLLSVSPSAGGTNQLAYVFWH